MKRPQVIAEVIEPGQCRYFHKGQRFTLGGFTPAGLCASAYNVLSRDAQTMRYGGTLPWARQGKVLTRCPDPQGALWQLQIEGEMQAADVGPNEASTQSDSNGQDGCQVQSCRGLQGTCPFALVNDASLARDIELAVRASACGPRLGRHDDKVPLHHPRLRVALAACPNACTMPQIRDVGMIATMSPQAIRPACNGCGRCEQACREEAITVRAGRAELHAERCVRCGQCIACCPSGAIESGPVKLRILVGGRMGRHPRWARELCETDLASAVEVVKEFLESSAYEASRRG